MLIGPWVSGTGEVIFSSDYSAQHGARCAGRFSVVEQLQIWTTTTCIILTLVNLRVNANSVRRFALLLVICLTRSPGFKKKKELSISFFAEYPRTDEAPNAYF